mmetsp:Transcript_37308/g.88676  ORF Transcript_37308/g.88676 Transcript_37308/m.88676 type:complete len:266 (+) Transcript_37308:178-975(+)
MARARLGGSLRVSPGTQSLSRAAAAGGSRAAFLRRLLRDAFRREGWRSRCSRAPASTPGRRSTRMTAGAAVDAWCPTIRDESAHTAPPSTPHAVIMRSPAAAASPKLSRTFFTGTPPKRSRNRSGHGTLKPTLLGRSSATGTPAPASSSTHAPSEPSFGQLAPPRARRTASARTSVRAPASSSIRTAGGGPPPGEKPTQRLRTWILTLRSLRSESQDRSTGAARSISGGDGNTRRDVPMKVSTPSPPAQALISSGPKSFSMESTA